MPKGKPEKKEVEVKKKDEVIIPMKDGAEVSFSPLTVEPKKEVLEPLGPGQKYFEAPDGTILIGEASSDRLLHRKGNGGRGEWINPKRG